MRVVQIDGEPWFVAQDTCRALSSYIRQDDRVNTNAATQHLGADEKTNMPYVEAKRIGLSREASKAYGLALISESGLYKLITRSDKAEAKPFEEWVTRDVLPSIRKTGSY